MVINLPHWRILNFFPCWWILIPSPISRKMPPLPPRPQTSEFKGFTKITLLHVNSKETPASRGKKSGGNGYFFSPLVPRRPAWVACSLGRLQSWRPEAAGESEVGAPGESEKQPRARAARTRAARGRPRSAARAQSCAAPSRPPHLARAAAGARGSGQHNAPGPRPGRLEHITSGLSSKQLAVPSSPPPSPLPGFRRRPSPTPPPSLLRNPGGGGSREVRTPGGRGPRTGVGGGEKGRGARWGVGGRQLLKKNSLSLGGCLSPLHLVVFLGFYLVPSSGT